MISRPGNSADQQPPWIKIDDAMAAAARRQPEFAELAGERPVGDALGRRRALAREQIEKGQRRRLRGGNRSRHAQKRDRGGDRRPTKARAHIQDTPDSLQFAVFAGA